MRSYSWLTQYLALSLPLSPSFSLSLFGFLSFSLYLPLSPSLSISLSLPLSHSLPLSLSPSFAFSPSLPLSPSFSLFLSLPISLSLSLSLPLSLPLSLSPSFFSSFSLSLFPFLSLSLSISLSLTSNLTSLGQLKHQTKIMWLTLIITSISNIYLQLPEFHWLDHKTLVSLVNWSYLDSTLHPLTTTTRHSGRSLTHFFLPSSPSSLNIYSAFYIYSEVFDWNQLSVVWPS